MLHERLYPRAPIGGTVPYIFNPAESLPSLALPRSATHAKSIALLGQLDAQQHNPKNGVYVDDEGF
jgi:hypothetical protein